MTAGEDVSFRNAAVVMQLGGVRLVLDSDRHNEGSRRNDGEYLLNDHWVLEPLLDNLHTSAAPGISPVKVVGVNSRRGIWLTCTWRRGYVPVHCCLHGFEQCLAWRGHTQ